MKISQRDEIVKTFKSRVSAGVSKSSALDMAVAERPRGVSESFIRSVFRCACQWVH